MRAIAPSRYRLAPVSDNPAPKRLLRTRSSDTCWSSWKKDTFEPVKQRFRDVVNVESGFALIEIDNQNREVMIRRSSLCLQAFAGGARHPFSPSSSRERVARAAARRAGDDEFHIGRSSLRRAASRQRSMPPRHRYLISRNSSMPYFEPSRPMPLSFMPPNGAISVEMMPSLMPTMPYSSASATRQMRPMSRA